MYCCYVLFDSTGIIKTMTEGGGCMAHIGTYAPPQGLGTLAKEFMAASRIMQSSSNELRTLVSGKAKM